MDYKNLDKIDIDDNGMIVLKDMTGSTFTANYANTIELNKLLTLVDEPVISIINNLLTEFFQKKQEKEKHKRYTPDSIKNMAKDTLTGIKKRKIDILTRNIEGYYRLLEDFEQKKMLSDDPKEIMRCEIEIDKTNIEINKISDEIEKLVN